MPRERQIMRLHAQGDVRVELVRALLADVEYAYNAILVFDTSVDQYWSSRREWGPFGPPWPLVLRRGRRVAGGPGGAWPPTVDEIASLVLARDRLVLAGVEIHSPGFWDLAGLGAALDVVRKWLNDRHERKKDRDWRERSDRERRELENDLLRQKLIAKKIENLKQLGVTERDLAPLINELLLRPLERLAQHQDSGLISTAERQALEEVKKP